MLIEAAKEQHEVYCCAAKWDDPEKAPQPMSSELTICGDSETVQHKGWSGIPSHNMGID
jgi:hypothetical protein